VLTHRQRVVRGAVSSEHLIQLFDGPESLGSGVAEFLAQGLAQHSHVLVVARPQHVEMITRQLAKAGHDPAALTVERRWIVLDARASLARFMRGGAPDAVLFESAVGDLVRRLAAESDGPLHVYGEMVDILAEEGSYAAVEALEGLWNELAATESFSLLCGYASSHFAAPKGSARLRAICHHHTRVHQNNEDLLANWLLTTVGDSAPA
jgi:hypothetical protein